MLNKLNISINKYADAQLFVSGQKKIQKLFEKDVFKAVTPNKVIMAKKLSSNIQVFNSYFADNIKDLYIDKTYEKSCQVVHCYNYEKKNLLLIYSSKISRISRDISSCLVAIIQNFDNNNIRFYLWNIMQAYIEVALNLNLDFYIRPFSNLILQLNASFDSIVRAKKPLYSEPEVNSHWFAIYHPYYKKKPKITKFAHNNDLVPYLTAVVGKSFIKSFFLLTILVPVFLDQA